jgi:HK97 family phage portal protein
MLTLAKAIAPKSYSNSAQSTSLQSPESWLYDQIHGHGKNYSGVNITPKNALGFTAIFRAISLISNSLSIVGKHRYERISSEERTKLDDNLTRVISQRPNQYMNAYDFWNLMGFWVNLWGNAFAIIKRNRFFEVTSLHPVTPSKVTISFKNGTKKYRIEGHKDEYYDNQIFHLKGPTLDGIIGLTPIRVFAQTIGVGLLTEDFQAKFYDKGTHSSGIVTMPEGFHLGTSEREIDGTIGKIMRSFRKVYAGSDNVGKVMMLEKGMDFKPLSMPLKDAEFIASRKFTIAEVSRMYGIPLHKLSELDRATHSNIEQQSIEYMEDAVLPWASRCEHELNIKLLTSAQRENQYFKFNVDSMIRADIGSRFDAYAKALGSTGPAWATTDWVQDKEDMPRQDPDKLFVPENMTTQSAKFNQPNDANSNS